MQAENPEDQKNTYAGLRGDLTYDARAQQICVFYVQNTVCYSATYQLDRCQFCAQAQCLQTPDGNYNARITEPSKNHLRMLVNRIRTFLVLNNCDNKLPALAHMHRLFYTITQ